MTDTMLLYELSDTLGMRLHYSRRRGEVEGSTTGLLKIGKTTIRVPLTIASYVLTPDTATVLCKAMGNLALLVSAAADPALPSCTIWVLDLAKAPELVPYLEGKKFPDLASMLAAVRPATKVAFCKIGEAWDQL